MNMGINVFFLAKALRGEIVAVGTVRCPAPDKGEDDRSVTVVMRGDSFDIEADEGDAQPAADHVKRMLVNALIETEEQGIF